MSKTKTNTMSEAMRDAVIKKPELIDQLVKNYGYTKKSATMLIQDFQSVVMDNLENGCPVNLYGFGCFDAVVRAERTCHHPDDNSINIVVPAHYVPRFYPGNAMKRAVKKWEDDCKRGLK